MKVINAHIDEMNESDRSIQVCSEAVPCRDEYCFQGVSNRGWGGTNCHMVQWCGVDPGIVRLEKLEQKSGPMAFWPGGGGMLEREMRPSEGYYIVGSWNSWKPEDMSKA